MPPPARGWMREAQTGVIGVSLTLPTSHGAHFLSCSALRMFVSTSVSRRRKAASPSEANISGILLPTTSSTTSSRSIKRQQSSCESFLPTLLLPHPINPINDIIITLFSKAPQCRATRGCRYSDWGISCRCSFRITTAAHRLQECQGR